MKRYDTLVIGAGPAGISAAIYLGRYNRSVLLLDHGNGRWNSHEHNENYLGFPEGIKTKELRQRGLVQAQNFGVTFYSDEIRSLEQVSDGFIATGSQVYEARSVILATGVTDFFPHFHEWKEYLGRSLFWCLTCDGYKTRGKKVVLLGDSNDAAETALQMKAFTQEVSLVTNKRAGESRFDAYWKPRFQQLGVHIYEDTLSKVEGTAGRIQALILSSGNKIQTDFLFSSHTCTANTVLSRMIGVAEDTDGFILVDTHQKTNIPFVYAAGDVTKVFSHQVATAVHEGSMAAEAANYDLYLPEQKSL